MSTVTYIKSTKKEFEGLLADSLGWVRVRIPVWRHLALWSTPDPYLGKEGIIIHAKMDARKNRTLYLIHFEINDCFVSRYSPREKLEIISPPTRSIRQ